MAFVSTSVSIYSTPLATRSICSSFVAIPRSSKRVATSVHAAPIKPKLEMNVATRSVVAECFGTFLLTVLFMAAPGKYALVAAPLTLALLVSIIGKVSGCHVNPAVTLGFLATSQIAVGTALAYVVAQLVGAVLGVGFASSILGIAISAPVMSSRKATLFLEIISSALWMMAVYTSSTDGKSYEMPSAPLKIAAAFAIIIAIGGSANPAISTAQTLFRNSSFSVQTLYWAADVFGMTLGALIAEHSIVAKKQQRPPQGLFAFWEEQSRKYGIDIKSMGTAGLASYGIMNTLYYGVVFSFVYFKLGLHKEGLAKAWAITWAGSQVTKPLRLFLAVAMTPAMDRFLSKTGLIQKKSKNEELETTTENEIMQKPS